MNKVSIADFIDKIGDGIHGTPCYSENGSYYFVNGNNLKDGHIIVDSSTLKIEQNEYEKIKRPLNENTILISINGTIGNLAFYNGEKIALGKSACYLNVKSTESKHYIRYALSTQEFKKYALQVAHGSTIKNLAPEQIAEYTFFAPDSTSRTNIAYVLKVLDDKIENNKKICSELEAMAKTLYDYWFVQFDFPDENGKPYRTSGGEMVWNEQLKRKIPKGWEVTNIGKITANFDSKRIPLSQNERNSMKGDIPYYGATGVMDYIDQFIFDGQYVLIAEDGSVMDSDGHPIVQMIWGKTWVNNHAHVLEGGNGYSNELLYFVLKDIPVIKIMTGSIQKKINQDNLNNYKIPQIPHEIANQFTSMLKIIFCKLRAIKIENSELTKLRDWLLPLLMNGQARVE